MITITIPFKTPSVNHLYFNWQNRRILTKEARGLIEEISKTVKKQIKEVEFKEEKLEVEVEIYEKWYTKKGLVAKKDIANREKFLIDSVFKSLEIDDKFIFKHTMKKTESNEEKAIITITPVGDKEIIYTKG